MKSNPLSGKSSSSGIPRLQNWYFYEDQAHIPLLKELYLHIQDFYNLISLGELNIDRFEEALQSILLLFEENKPWGMFRAYVDGHLEEEDLGSKTTGFLVSAVLFSRCRNLKPQEQFLLLKAGLVHDTGMLRLPQNILEVKGRMEEEERKLMMTHPEESRKIALQLELEGALCRAVFEHHERYDGQGYPQGLKGEEISYYAQIILLLDTFVALISNRSYRSGLIGYYAIRDLLQEENKLVSRRALEDFLSTFGFHPPSSLVLMSDGSIARSLESFGDNPLRPLVRVLVDSQGQVYQGESFPYKDLSKETDLFIVRPLENQDMDSPQ